MCIYTLDAQSITGTTVALNNLFSVSAVSKPFLAAFTTICLQSSFESIATPRSSALAFGVMVFLSLITGMMMMMILILIQAMHGIPYELSLSVTLH